MKIAHVHVWDKQNKGDLGIVEAVQDLLGKNIENLELVDVPVDQLKLAEDQWLLKINNCDLVVIGGGGIYYRWFLPYNLDFINKIKPPIIIFGVGYINELGSPPLSKNEIQSIIELNKKAVFTSVRDENTYTFLKENGFAGEVSVIGDPAVFLKEKPVKIDFGKVSVGFNLNYSGWLGFSQYQDKILSAYRECIDELVANYEAKIFYLVHHPGEYKIIPKLERTLEIIDLPPKQQKYVYGKLNVVVGMMLHAGVMAFGAGTPIVSVAYDIRNIGFMKYIGQEDFVILPEDLNPDILKNKIKLLLENEKKYREEYFKRKNEMSLKTDQFLKKFCKTPKIIL